MKLKELPMESTESVKKLCSLAQLDIDAIHAYSQAIDKIEVVGIKEQLIQFRADHQRHVDNLSDCIRRSGGEPPAFQKDFKGFLIEGFTALRSVTGTEGALKAMKGNEKLTNRTYDEALNWDVPQDIRIIIEANREDEKRHLNYIETCLENRAWEQGSEAA